MSNEKLPDYRLKQKILYTDKTSPEILKNYGDLFLESGDISDALDFYHKAKYSDGINKIKEMAVDAGDIMIFQLAMKALNKEPSLSDWEKIGQKAVALKKYFFAKEALEKAGKQDEVNSLLKIIETGNHKSGQ